MIKIKFLKIDTIIEFSPNSYEKLEKSLNF